MTTETKHTAGPWMAKDGHGGSFDIVGSGHDWVATVHNGHDADEANAALIASAPDLLAALEAVLRVADRATDEFDAARAAIRKARGEA